VKLPAASCGECARYACSRWTNGLADIEGIMALHKAVPDWSIIEEYFALSGSLHIRPGYEVIGGRGRMGFGGGRR